MVVKRKNKPAQPIGKGKPGSLKRAVYKAGGGKKTLKTLRSAPKATRKMVAKTKGVNVKGAAKSVRTSKLKGTPTKSKPKSKLKGTLTKGKSKLKGTLTKSKKP
ncbi:MAG: hypothetical protein DRH30_00550 [Deltaproteobacteria bacterium]|nr:MAG: hypothetical protein DRH30_00550 [Deltaproteobacteria bacterium]